MFAGRADHRDPHAFPARSDSDLRNNDEIMTAEEFFGAN
jgi:hypothetical protein